MGLYAAASDNYALARGNQSVVTELWDHNAEGEILLQFRAGNVIGEPVAPSRGSALGELPWAFRADPDECTFIGEGSVSDRSPEIVVLAPEGGAPASATGSHAKNDHVLDRAVYKITEATTFKTSAGNCLVKPSSEQAVEQDYHLSGQRFHDLECAYPLFRGPPVLRLAKTGRAPRALPANQIAWRQTGGEWQQHPDAFGPWQLRHVRNGELRLLGRVGILPDGFGVSLHPGSDLSKGFVLFKKAEAVKAAGRSPEIAVTSQVAGNAVRVHVTALDSASPPSRAQLRLHWQGATELFVSTPFPGHGARFLREGQPMRPNEVLAVNDLYGVRATALSPDETEKFWVEGVLRAPDVGNLRPIAYFRKAIHRSGMTHELSLSDLRPMVELLLAASSSGEASVSLQIYDRYQQKHGSRTSQAIRCRARIHAGHGLRFRNTRAQECNGGDF